MSPGRRIAIGVGAVVVAVLLGVGVAALFFGDDGGGDGDSVSAGSSTTSSSAAVPTTVVEESTTTTFDLVPESTTSTTARPVTTTTSPPAPVVTGSGAVLRAPSSAAKRTMTGEECSTLATSGWSAECGFARVKGGGRLVWLVESKPVSVGSSVSARRASVLVPDGNQWRVVLAAADDDGTRWKSVAVRVLDVSADGGEEVVFGFRAAGSGGALAVDVVEGPAPGAVTAHVDLRQGTARVSTGQLDTWAYVSGSGSTARYQHDLIRWQDGAWRIVSRTQVAASDVPPSQF